MSAAVHRPQRSPVGGRFRIDREVGRGGVGIVYQALDMQTNRPVALKVIAAHGVDEAEEARFAREGRVLAELDHPHIVKLVAWGTLDEGPYVAMEWLEGEDLAARTRRQPLSLGAALDVARQIANALSFAHAAGIVHRDIKPSNIFLTGAVTGPGAGENPGERPPFAKLVDFGVAGTEQDVRLTRTGVVIGTPAYMAPEQARAEGVVDARADIYSLGATLFELVAGRPPHVGPTAIATLARLVTTEAPRLSELVVDVPQGLEDLVTRMLATQPADRPATADEVSEALAGVIAGEPSGRLSLPPAAERMSAAPMTQGTRLVTSIVAIGLSRDGARSRAVEHLRARGADAVPIGHDGIVAHLGARRALGDEATRALDLGRRLGKAGGRVGIATGRTQVNLTRPVGEVVDRAATLARSAEDGQVLADTTTTELARGRFEFQVRKDGAAAVGESLRGKRQEGSGGAPFVGREAELAQIMSAYDRCVEDQTPVLVSVTGSPGIGKSRLGREVLTRVASHADPPRIVVVRCETFGKAHALGVAADILRALVGIPKGASLTATTEALTAHRQSVAEQSWEPPGSDSNARTEGRTLLAHLMANEPLPGSRDERGARDALWVAMTEFVLTSSAREPAILTVEDIQWADPESVAFLDHLLGRAAGRALAVLALTRPAFWREPGARFVGRDHTKIELRPISRRAARAIARALLGEQAPEATLDRIAAQAAGSPLFAEELARLTGLGRDATSAPTIEAAIQVSLDGLDDAAREAATKLSVFGLTAWDTGLEALGVSSPSPLLRTLAAHELLVEQAEARFAGAREWAFKHALVRDVAYASLGAEDRARLHALAAEWLAKIGEDAATVAEHFHLGGREIEAAEYWFRAGRHALSTHALAQAVKMAERALAYAEDKPTTFARAQLLDEAWARLDPRAADRETAVRAMRESVHDEPSEVRAAGADARYDHARGMGRDIEQRLARVKDRARALGLLDEEARTAAVLATRLAFGGNLPAAEAAAAELLDLAERRSLPQAAVDGWQTLAVVRQTRGELASALEARRSAAKAASAAGRKEREAMLTMNVGFALTTIGARQEARQSLETGLEIAQSIGSAGALRHGKMNLLGWSATFGADPSLDALLAEPRADADAAAGGHWVTSDRATLGLLFYRACELLTLEGTTPAARALSLLKITAEAYRSTGNHDVLPVALGFLALAERRAGDAGRALEIASEAAALLEQGAPSLLNEGPVFLALHDAAVDMDDLRGAKSAIGRAIPPLLRRMRGLAGTPYAKSFLTQLPYNAALVATAEAYGVIPPEIEKLLERGAS